MRQLLPLSLIARALFLFANNVKAITRYFRCGFLFLRGCREVMDTHKFIFAKPVKILARIGCMALVNVKSYSQAAKPFSTKKTK